LELPRLSCSQSTGALTDHVHKDTPRPGSEIEHVLQTALGLSGSAPTQHASRNALSSGICDIEAHLAKLLDITDGQEIGESENSEDHGNKEADIVCRDGSRPHRLNALREVKEEHRAKVVDEHGDNENNIRRKGTGFIHLQSHRAKINDDRGDNENKLRRKGTGFIHVGSSSDLSSCSRARIADSRGDNENRLQRKGTGFVHLKDLPMDPPSVWFPDLTGGRVNGIQRKGTGFVVLNHVSPRVRIADVRGDNENSIQRKGTGYVDLSDCKCGMLPSSPSSCSVGSQESTGAHLAAINTDVALCEHQDSRSLVETL